MLEIHGSYTKYQATNTENSKIIYFKITVSNENVCFFGKQYLGHQYKPAAFDGGLNSVPCT